MELLFASNIILHNRTLLIPIYRFIYLERVFPTFEYTRQLRAGQQLDMFVLSRSREHGLRPGQHVIRFEAIDSDSVEVTYFGGAPTESHKITVNILLNHDLMADDRVKELLNRLVEQPVD
jgi:hypothetical protein